MITGRLTNNRNGAREGDVIREGSTRRVVREREKTGDHSKRDKGVELDGKIIFVN